jgi:hypothetical protein
MLYKFSKVTFFGLYRFEYMKRTILVFLLVFGLLAPAFAQDWGRGRVRPNITRPEVLTVSGNLIVAHGMPALRSGEVTYLISGINRLVGFVEGLNEGAYVSVEGWAITSPRDDSLKILRSTTLTMDGRSYDLAPPGQNFSLRDFRQINPLLRPHDHYWRIPRRM